MQKQLVEYLKEIKELHEERVFYSNNVNSLRNEINRLGRRNSYAEPRYGRKKLLFFTTNSILVEKLIVLCCIVSLICIATIIIGICNKESKDTLAAIGVGLLIFISPILIDVIRVKIQNKSIYKKEISNYNALLSQDNERVEYELNVKKPPLVQKLNYNEKIVRLIDNKLNDIYSDDVIPPKYRNYQSAVMFYDYVSNLRCDTIKECIRVFELDMKAVYIQDRISMLDCRINELQRTMANQINSLRSSIKKTFNRSQNYIANSLRNTEERLDTINRSMLIEQLYINDLYNKGD